jgi:hypothetical protein
MPLFIVEYELLCAKIFVVFLILSIHYSRFLFYEAVLAYMSGNEGFELVIGAI